MGLKSVSYDYNERKITVDASDCECKIDISETDTGEAVYGCKHNLVGKHSVWAKLDRVWHCDYTIKVFINGVLEYIERTSLKDKTVLVKLDSVAIGDSLAWFPYIIDFQKKNGCNVLASTFHNYLFEKFETKNIKLVNPAENVKHDVCYKIGVFTDSKLDPVNFRIKPLQKCCADILNVLYREKHLDLRHLAGLRPIKEKYAVICPTSTMDCKEWKNVNGWQGVVDYLNSIGYKVISIPNEEIKLKGIHECIVDKDLVKGALTYIKHAEILVGLSSGLSWVARCVNTPVVIIAGFTEPFNEFKSGCKRIINRSVCHGCYHDVDLKYDRYRHWCPRNKAFECSKNITVESVKEAILQVISLETKNKQRILCVLPHCSTGGLPQYFLEKLKVLMIDFDVYVIEWSFQGEAHNIQRKQIRELCTEFIEISAFRKEFQDVVNDILPDVVHFEEFPSMFRNNKVLMDFHNLHRQKIHHTSHSYLNQEVWKADKYVFPSEYQKKIVYPELKGEVIEYPIFDNFVSCSSEKSVLNVGILSPHKNQKYLVELAKKMPNTKFYFVGGFADNFRDYWKPLVASAPINCIFLGQQNSEQIEKLYKKCSVMFHSSTIELCPIVFSEAISYGIPIIVNWLDPYEYLNYNKIFTKAVMKIEEDVKVIETILINNQRTQYAQTFDEFKVNVSLEYSL